VGAAGDERHIVPMFGKPGSDDAADASRPENDEPHGQIVPRSFLRRTSVTATRRYCRDPNEPIDRISAGPCRFVSPVSDLKAADRVVTAIYGNVKDAIAASVLQKA
jgi:hypothetical protein